MNDATLKDLTEYLEGHESDIAIDIDDYGELYWVFAALIGREPLQIKERTEEFDNFKNK